MEHHPVLGDKVQDGKGINDSHCALGAEFMPEALGRFKRPKPIFVK